jgi:DNA-binding CsgD family transcriptional regulator
MSGGISDGGKHGGRVTMLAELEREATRLVIAGLSLAEIANSMRLPKGAVRKLLGLVSRKIAVVTEARERSET